MRCAPELECKLPLPPVLLRSQLVQLVWQQRAVEVTRLLLLGWMLLDEPSVQLRDVAQRRLLQQQLETETEQQYQQRRQVVQQQTRDEMQQQQLVASVVLQGQRLLLLVSERSWMNSCPYPHRHPLLHPSCVDPSLLGIVSLVR